jgi:hypothetical protein
MMRGRGGDDTVRTCPPGIPASSGDGDSRSGSGPKRDTVYRTRRKGERTERATTRGRPDGRSWNGRERFPVSLHDRVVQHACAFGWKRAGQRPVCAAGQAAPSRERTTDWNGTGTRQQRCADGQVTDGLETGRTRRGEGRSDAGPPWCSIHRFDTMKPAGSGDARRRAAAGCCGERTSIWRHRRRKRSETNGARPRETGGPGNDPGAADRRPARARHRASGQA